MKKALILFYIFPSLLFAQTSMSYIDLGIEAYNQDNYKEALDLFTKAIELDNHYDKAYFNRALVKAALKRPQDAYSDYLEVLEKTQDDDLKVKTYIRLSYLYRNQFSDPEKALLYINQALQIEPKSGNAFYAKGLILHDLNELHESIKYFSKAIKIYPNDPYIYYDRAIAHRKLNQYKQSVRDNSIAIKLKPTYHSAYNNRAYTKTLMGKYEEAINDLNKAIFLNRSSYSHNNRGYAKYKLGQYEEAKIDCQKAVELDPQNSWAYHYLGLAYYGLGKKDKACMLFQKAVELGKHDAAIDLNTKCREF